jgi:hypothetical protein
VRHELPKTTITGMKNKILQFNLALLVVAFTVASPHLSLAGEYYVSTTGSASNPGTLAQPWTLAKANTTLVAGDTVYILAGTYSTYINPSNSGTSSNRITYRNYGTDGVTISGANYAVYLDGRSYITVQGINATNCAHFLYIINGGTYNIIAYCTFDQESSPDWDVSVIHGSSQYNWVHHCRFSNCGSANDNGDDTGSVLDIGSESDGTDHSWYNLIENSTFFHGGHHVVALMSSYNTFRNNYIHNEAWTGAYGNRCLYSNAPSSAAGKNIIEGNKWGYAWTSVDDGPVGNVVITSPSNIVRYNSIYHSNAYGIGVAGYSGYSNGSSNRIYNNTLFNNGLALSSGSEDCAVYVTNQAGQTPTGNVFKNNLYYRHYQVYSGSNYSSQTYANEYNGDVSGDPLFVNASTTPPTDKTNSALPNLSLQSASPAIGKGGALTTVSSGCSASTKSITVADASYFQDGTFAPAGTIYGDWIAVGTVGNVVQISSISTNTVTLANAISCTNGNSVWLYKKSDGVQVLYGSAPDAGAYEFQQTDEPPSAPRDLKITP